MGKKWSEEDLEYLEDSWGNVSVPKIAENLGRTVKAVRQKAVRLGLGRHLDSAEEISLNVLIKALGYKDSYTWIKEKFIRYGCPIKYKKVINQKVRVVKLEKFWKWAENNKNIFNFADFDENALGKEPTWVKEKRKLDKGSVNRTNRNRLWTKEEDILLISKVKNSRYTYSDLAEDFKRSELAIKKRLERLKVPYRPIPRDTHTKWTLVENRRLLELYKEGYTSSLIAKELNKSELSVGERIQLLKSRPEGYKTKTWTMAEEQYLLKYKKEKSLGELADELGRSKTSICKKYSRLLEQNVVFRG